MSFIVGGDADHTATLFRLPLTGLELRLVLDVVRDGNERQQQPAYDVASLAGLAQCRLGPLRNRLRSPDGTRTSNVRPSR